jgi:hypothetical protein
VLTRNVGKLRIISQGRYCHVNGFNQRKTFYQKIYKRAD